MPINTDLNISPYFDDFDETKNYHRILFRPSTPVQARELTQLQTIMQNQIERFGNWAFKNGDVVSGCTPYDMPVVPYVRLVNFASNSSSNSVSFNPNQYIGNTVVEPSTNLHAIIMYANSGFITNYPDTNILYLRYLNTGNNGATEFSNNSLLRIKKVETAGNTWLANIYTYSNVSSNTYATGNSHGISFSEGIIFINGNFVRVTNSTYGVVNKHDVYAGNNVVGFMLDEQIISENDDESLLDNALGYPNENAPGSHRLKLVPVVMSMTESEAANTDNFNPVGRYNYGSFVAKSVQGSNLYSVVGDVIAKRTYEESGNYVVNPFSVDTVTNTGDTNVAPENANSILARVSPGIGYSQGQRVELLKTSYINMRRGTTTKTYETQQITFSYGSYFVLNEVAGTFDFTKAETVDLYDTPQAAVTDRQFSALTPNGVKIGTAKARCFSYNSGNPGTATAKYLLHVFDIKMTEPSYSTSQIKSVHYDGTRKGVGDVVGVLTNSQNKQQLYSFGYRGLKNLRDQSNNLNTLYDYRTKYSNTMNTSGDVTIVITNGNEILPYGNVYSLPDAEATNFTLVVAANTDSANLTGNVSVNTTSNVVTGNGSAFDSYFGVGDQIKISNGSVTDIRTVTYITNTTAISVDAPFSFTASGLNYQKTYLQGKILPISMTGTGPGGFIEITNSNTFTIHSGQFPASSMNVDVYFNIRKINAVNSTKAIRKNRFVKINTANNPGGPNGPWCLGFPDIHNITAIYANTGSVSTSSPNVTNNFVFDTGQLDTHYGLGYLYTKGGYDASNTNLLVQLDYFEANLSSGVGFFSIESYPIDDANTANTNAIQTKDIPLYVTESGYGVPLRDVIDFRIPANNTANDTGSVDISNSAQVTTAVSYATVNPSANLTLKISAAKGIDTPAYGKNFESDYTRYLPRKDLIMITPDNILKVKEGSSGDAPQTPQLPENAMPLAVLNIPSYPSLTSDQVDEFLRYNQRSKNVIRDTSTAISGNIITNRRYTMKDIGKLDQRITNLEYYTQLSLLEKQAKDLTVTDANGLDRFKNGIFVDPFSSSSLGDVSNPEYSVAIDTSKGVARPKIVREVFKMNFNEAASTDTVQTGRFITLPYFEIPFITQPYATKFRSAALVAFAWNGKCTLIPAYDNHMDDVNTGSINITIDNTVPWKEMANSPFGLTWGDWRTTTDVVSNTVSTGTVTNIDFRARGMQLSGFQIQLLRGNAWLERLPWGDNIKNQTTQALIASVQRQAAAAGINPNLVVGNLTVLYGGQLLTKL